MRAPSGPSSGKARVARYCQPGPMWYLAVCEWCRWTGLSWKDRDQAKQDRDDHNERSHSGSDRGAA